MNWLVFIESLWLFPNVMNAYYVLGSMLDRSGKIKIRYGPSPQRGHKLMVGEGKTYKQITRIQVRT